MEQRPEERRVPDFQLIAARAMEKVAANGEWTDSKRHCVRPCEMEEVLIHFYRAMWLRSLGNG